MESSICKEDLHNSQPISLNSINNNKFLLILKRTSSFLSTQELMNLLTLSKFFNFHLQVPEITNQLLFSFLSFLTNTKTYNENVFNVFEIFSGISTSSLPEIIEILKKSSTNLVKNPSGKLGFKHWKVRSGGDGWCVGHRFTYKHMKTVYASSFEWGSLGLEVDLKGVLQPGIKSFLVAGSPVCRRFDCGGYAKIRIKMLGKYHRQKCEKLELLERIDGDPWLLIINKIEIIPEDEVAVVEFFGKDANWWGDHYGARFGYCYTYILNQYI